MLDTCISNNSVMTYKLRVNCESWPIKFSLDIYACTLFMSVGSFYVNMRILKHVVGYCWISHLWDNAGLVSFSGSPSIKVKSFFITYLRKNRIGKYVSEEVSHWQELAYVSGIGSPEYFCLMFWRAKFNKSETTTEGDLKIMK